MHRSILAVVFIMSALLLLGCGESSSTRTGDAGSVKYDRDGGGSDSSMSVDGEAGTAETGSEANTGESCVACSPSEIAFDPDASVVAQVTIYLDPTAQTCTSFTGYNEMETLVLDDMGEGPLSGSFGSDWTPSNASAGTLDSSQGYWGWLDIPRATPVTVTVTHTNGTIAVLDFTANEPTFSSVTIRDTCFQ